MLAGILLVVMPLETGYVFDKFFSVNGWASRPVTNPGSDALDWVDKAVGTGASVTEVPYPVSSAFFVNERVWRDYEFWNKSIVRDVQYTGKYVFRFTSDTFPKLFPRFDPTTGIADLSPTRYVLQADQESRFRISGPTVVQGSDSMLIDAGKAWRTDWLSYGLYDDGWTEPGVTARVRVFAKPGQRGSLVRLLTFQVRPPDTVKTRRVNIVSNLESWHLDATNTHTLLQDRARVCPCAGLRTDSTRHAGQLGDPGRPPRPALVACQPQGRRLPRRDRPVRQQRRPVLIRPGLSSSSWPAPCQRSPGRSGRLLRSSRTERDMRLGRSLRIRTPGRRQADDRQGRAAATIKPNRRRAARRSRSF